MRTVTFLIGVCLLSLACEPVDPNAHAASAPTPYLPTPTPVATPKLPLIEYLTTPTPKPFPTLISAKDHIANIRVDDIKNRLRRHLERDANLTTINCEGKVGSSYDEQGQEIRFMALCTGSGDSRLRVQRSAAILATGYQSDTIIDLIHSDNLHQSTATVNVCSYILDKPIKAEDRCETIYINKEQWNTELVTMLVIFEEYK